MITVAIPGFKIDVLKCNGMFLCSRHITRTKEAALNAKAIETPTSPKSLIARGTIVQFNAIHKIINLTDVFTLPIALNILIAGVVKLTSNEEIRKKLNEGIANVHF